MNGLPDEPQRSARARLNLYLRRSAYAAFGAFASAMVAPADQTWALRGGGVDANADATGGNVHSTGLDPIGVEGEICKECP